MESKPNQNAEVPTLRTQKPGEDAGKTAQGQSRKSLESKRQRGRDKSSARRDGPASRRAKKAPQVKPIRRLLERAIAAHRPFQTIIDFLKVREIVMLKNLNRRFKREVIGPKFTESRKALIYSETLSYKLASRFLKLFSGVEEIILRPSKNNLSTQEVRKMIAMM